MIRPLRPLIRTPVPRRRRVVLAALTLVGAGLLLGSPSATLAATDIAPAAATFDVSSSSATTATVDGIVNPEGQSTTYAVQYDLASSSWCMTGSGSPANTTTPASLSFTDDNFHLVSVDLSALTADTQYCAQLIATNSSGTGQGGQVPWTQGTPTANTLDASSTGATTATVDGDVNPAGQSTTYKVVYDTAASDWCTSFGASGSPASTTGDTALVPTDDTFHDVSVNLTGLVAGTQYCAEVVATNGTGSTPTNDGDQVQWTQGIPTAFSLDGFSTGATTATVEGQVNPANQATTYKIVYDTAASTWCTSFGASGLPAHSTTATALAFTDNAFHNVSVNLTGLTAGTPYCAEVVATNGSGSTPTNDGDQATWTEGVPTAQTLDASSTGATTATVDGSVNPAGQSTTYKVVYDTAASTWCTSFGASGSPTNSTSATALGSTDNSFHDVSMDVSGLVAGTQYCAEVVATNGSGSTPANDGDQVFWTEGLPAAQTLDANSTGTTTATVDGSVNPTGQSTTYKAVYDTAASTWCASGGSSGSPANSTSATALGSTDDTFHDVSVDVSGLVAGTQYCAEIVATNGTGSTPSDDGDQAFWTEGNPVADTFDAISTGATTATVDGDVNPAAQSTTIQVQWDVASSDWCTSFGASGSPANSTSGPPFSFTDTSFHDVSVDLTTGLTAGTSYCAQLTATNAGGTAQGGQVQWTQGSPLAETDDGVPTSPTAATVDGSVNPAGQSTTYKAVYDTAGSEWCTSGGSTGSPASSTTATTLGFTDSTSHAVSVSLTGLAPGAGYCAEIVASNGTGSTPTDDGDQVSWTQPSLPKHMVTVSRTGIGSGTVTSSPAGINCGSTCSSSFDTGTQVTLTATAAAGSTFAGWSGGGCSGTGTCKVTLNADTTVSAVFGKAAPNTHTLSLSLAGTGTGTVTSSPAGISCGSTCSSPFNAGTQVTLTATADSGSTFAGWSGGGCSGTGACVLTLNADTAVTATFNGSPPPPSPATKCIVPKLKGKTLAAAKRSIQSHHCGVGKITKVSSSPKNKGHVISQSPKPGKHLRKGSKVALKVGK